MTPLPSLSRNPRPLLATLSVAALLLAGGAADLPTARASKCPNVQLVIDTSANMAATLDLTSRLGSVKSVLSLALAKYELSFRFGLTVFPTTAASCDESNPVLPDFSNGPAVNMTLSPIMAAGSSSTGTAISSVAALPALTDASRPQYIILITSTAPSCGSGSTDTVAGTVTAIANAYAQTPSIPTFVVGVGTAAGTDTAALNLMAIAGGRPLLGTTFYGATTLLNLGTTILSIFNVINTEVGTCSDSPGSDMGGPTDMSAIPDLSKPVDMRMSIDMAKPVDLMSHDMSMQDDFGLPPPIDFSTADQSGNSTNPPPEVDWIDPKQLTFGTGGSANIVGRHFVTSVPQSQVFFSDEGSLMAITNALVTDSSNIQVSIPGDLPVGTYDVLVQNPDGQIGKQPGALTIVDKPSGCSCRVGAPAPAAGSGTAGPGAFFALLFSIALLRLKRQRAQQKRS